jgi:hypothetical protein
MKRKGLPVLGVLSVYGMLTASLGAQSASTHPSFNIPFEFSVLGKTMPAGEYQVSSPSTEVVRVTHLTGGHESLATLANGVGTSGLGDQPKLFFHRYANQYFLAQATIGQGYRMFQVPASREEREAARTASSRGVQTVTLAALVVGR